MATATLGKWGNSQALTVPSVICNALGLTSGEKAVVEYDLGNSSVTYRFNANRNKYSRSKKMSMEEFAEGWSGGKVGEEWGGNDVGSEIVE